MAAVKRHGVQPVVFRTKEQHNRPGQCLLPQLLAERLDVAAQRASRMGDGRCADDIDGVGERLVERGVDADGGNYVFGVMGEPRQLLRVKGARVDQPQL